MMSTTKYLSKSTKSFNQNLSDVNYHNEVLTVKNHDGNSPNISNLYGIKKTIRVIGSSNLDFL